MPSPRLLLTVRPYRQPCSIAIPCRQQRPYSSRKAAAAATRHQSFHNASSSQTPRSPQRFESSQRISSIPPPPILPPPSPPSPPSIPTTTTITAYNDPLTFPSTNLTNPPTPSHLCSTIRFQYFPDCSRLVRQHLPGSVRAVGFDWRHSVAKPEWSHALESGDDNNNHININNLGEGGGRVIPLVLRRTLGDEEAREWARRRWAVVRVVRELAGGDDGGSVGLVRVGVEAVESSAGSVAASSSTAVSRMLRSGVLNNGGLESAAVLEVRVLALLKD